MYIIIRGQSKVNFSCDFAARSTGITASLRLHAQSGSKALFLEKA